jgi:hypothetical protein
MILCGRRDKSNNVKTIKNKQITQQLWTRQLQLEKSGELHGGEII